MHDTSGDTKEAQGAKRVLDSSGFLRRLLRIDRRSPALESLRHGCMGNGHVHLLQIHNPVGLQLLRSTP
jgi:hypothetical protein